MQDSCECITVFTEIYTDKWLETDSTESDQLTRFYPISTLPAVWFKVMLILFIAGQVDLKHFGVADDFGLSFDPFGADFDGQDFSMKVQNMLTFLLKN